MALVDNRPKKDSLCCYEDSWVICTQRMGCVIFFLNMFDPPLGTFVGAMIDRDDCNKKAAKVAVYQLLTVPFLFGWVWAIYWAWKIWRGNWGHV